VPCIFDKSENRSSSGKIKNIYQLDFITPGSLPSEARFLKQIRQIPNFLIKALALPHIGHRLYALTLNFGFFIAFILKAFLANSPSFYTPKFTIFENHFILQFTCLSWKSTAKNGFCQEFI